MRVTLEYDPHREMWFVWNGGRIAQWFLHTRIIGAGRTKEEALDEARSKILNGQLLHASQETVEL